MSNRRYVTPEEKARLNTESSARHALLYPKKRSARNAATHALEGGRLPPPPTICPKCGKTPAPLKSGRRTMQMHHHKGYDHPLDIEWLCLRCHRAETEIERPPRDYKRRAPLSPFCGNGHDLTGDNLRMYRGRRCCRACERNFASIYRARAKEAL